MRRYLKTTESFLRLAAVCVVLAVVSIPVLYATHAHTQSQGGCGDHHHAGFPYTEDCDFCVYYAHYIPKDATFPTPYAFQTPITPLLVLHTPEKRTTPCKGVAYVDANRGPPAIPA